MSEITAEQREALEIAHRLVDLGAPIFTAKPNSLSPGEFFYAAGWQHCRPRHEAVDAWRPGDALCMVTGVVYDVIDVDPRNGGKDGITELATALGWGDGTPGPEPYGQVATPSAGEHIYIGLTGLAKGKAARGVDLQAGERRGEGRGFVFLPPTVRPSKYGERKGLPVAYRWTSVPTRAPGAADPGLDAFRNYVAGSKPVYRAPVARTAVAVDDDDPFDGGVSPWTPESAMNVIKGQLRAVWDAEIGTINSTLGGAARMLGRFVGGGWLDRDQAESWLLNAIERNPYHSDAWNRRNGKDWTAASVIAAGMAKGEVEPMEVVTSASSSEQSHSALSGGGPGPAPEVGVAGGGNASSSGESVGVSPAVKSPVSAAGDLASMTYPRLRIQGAATMAYWLQQEIGNGRLGGFFARRGELVHTPRVGETGYVPPADDRDDNGPAEIRAVSPDVLAAKLQFLYACFKEEDVKDEAGKKTGEKQEVPAMFPTAAAKVVVNAPEALSALRTLRGVTHTPMVRRDGSVLTAAGYDAASGYLYLPPPGLKVAPVPEDPDPVQVETASRHLLLMIKDFPFATDDDRANYLGLLLTPLLRELAPPSYKMFGIGAHQPGSGKSLLAEVAGKIHGWVFRSDVPEDEPEWRKATASILATTSAPLVVLDNVNGVLRSSVLAGLLTASGDIEDRELGKSSNLRFRNDRVWVVTGNNLSLGGDLVRRTITILIDPNMANPETRTEFAIPNLPAWVDEHRGDILWSLLVLIRAWVAAGRPEQARRQSDSYAAWEKAVGGILEHAGITGFDQESGKRAAAGGDDDGLATLLDHLYERFGDKGWSVAEALAPAAEPGTGFVIENRDWLPAIVLDRLSRSEASGRASFGKWLQNRMGRWVVTDGGRAMVIRSLGKERMVARWAIEVR